MLAPIGPDQGVPEVRRPSEAGPGRTNPPGPAPARNSGQGKVTTMRAAPTRRTVSTPDGLGTPT